MFSCVVSGRLPLTATQQVDETHAVFHLEQAQDISHVAVFMTGQQPFPPGFSATVHFLWPGQGKTWILLGCLKNTKPSAIFRLKSNVSSTSSSSAMGSHSAIFSNPADNTALVPVQLQPQGVTALLGISVEPDHLVDAQMAALNQVSQSTSSSSTINGNPVDLALQLAPKIAKNAFSYLSSFAPDSAPQTVPLLQRWLEQLERKLRSQGAEFLDKAD